MVEREDMDIEPKVNFFDIISKHKRVAVRGISEDTILEMPKIISVYDVQKR